MDSIEDLSTDAVAAMEKAQKSPPKPPKAPSTKAITQAARHQHERMQSKDVSRGNQAVAKKLAKVEQYHIHFKGELKGRYKKLGPDSSEAEVDAQLQQIDKELSSLNAPKFMEAAWVSLIKVAETAYSISSRPGGLALDYPLSISNVAAGEDWLQKVRGNLRQVQIKYGLFEQGPEIQLLLTLADMAFTVDRTNKAMLKLNTTDLNDFREKMTEEQKKRAAAL